jgi:hypothetical protein
MKRLARNLPRNDPVFLSIKEKAQKINPKIADRTIRYRIQKFREKHKIIVKKMAKYAYAVVEYNIDVQKFLKEKPDLAKELQSLVRTIVQESQFPRDKKTEIKSETKLRPISKKVTNVFGLPANLKNEAERMTEAYQAIYIFENLIRHVVMTILENKYGKDWWNNPRVVSKEIKDHVESRKKEEKKNRWHAIRGSHDIFYTDFGALNRIITTNIVDFRDVFGDLEIQSEMRQLERSRNIIAHNNPLPKRELDRIQMYYKDLTKQLGIYSES